MSRGDVLEHIVAQRSRLTSGECDVTVETIEKVSDRHLKEIRRTRPEAAKETVHKASYHVRWQGRRWAADEVPSLARAGESHFEDHLFSDGEKLILWFDRIGGGPFIPGGVIRKEQPYDPLDPAAVAYSAGSVDTEAWLRESSVRSIRRQSSSEFGEVVIIELVTKFGDSQSVWLAPNRMWQTVHVHFEGRGTSSDAHGIRNTSQFVRLGDLWIPSEVRDVSWWGALEHPESLRTKTISFKNIRLNTDPGPIRLTAPKGTGSPMPTQVGCLRLEATARWSPRDTRRPVSYPWL